MKSFGVSLTIMLLVCLHLADAYAQADEGQLFTEREYVIGNGDELDIQVWQDSMFTQKSVVRTDGNITFPVLGDIHVAGLKVSMLKVDLEDRLGEYIKEPSVNLAVSRSAQTIPIKLSGAITQEIEIPRGTTFRQLLPQLLPRLQQTKTPAELTAITIIGVEEEFSINAQEVLAGRGPSGMIRLEWGDEIVIPSVAPVPESHPESHPQEVLPVLPPNQAEYTEKEYSVFLQTFPYAEVVLQPFVTTAENGNIRIALDALSDEHREVLGEEAFRELEAHFPTSSQVPGTFTDIVLAGILKSTISLEVFLLIPDPDVDGKLIIRPFKRGELITDEIFLDSISPTQVVLRKGDADQTLPLPQLSNEIGNLVLSGIVNLGQRKEVFFIDTTSDKSSLKSPLKQRFKENDVIKNDIRLSQISKDWIRLERGPEVQLLFLRDTSYVQIRKDVERKEIIRNSISILLVGDSTVENTPKPGTTMCGWGKFLPDFFVDTVTMSNHAKAGRSSKSFITEGRWDEALAQKADYIFIQFGHNDDISQGAATLRTNADTDYREYLRKYVDDARAAGIIPILVTPMSRFKFTKDGALNVQRMTLLPYVEAMKTVSREKDVHLIDLHTSSVQLLTQLGKVGSLELMKSEDDDQHHSAKGAYKMAELLTNELPRVVPSLAVYLK